MISKSLRTVAFACACAPLCGHSQPLFEELGGGVGLLGIYGMLADPTNDRLLLDGWFAHANEEQVSPGILQWDQTGFTSFGCGVEWDCVSPGSLNGIANPSRTVAVWNGDVYLGGDFFFTRGGVEYNFIMRWDGIEWHPLDSDVDGPVKSLKVIDGELYAARLFTYADTVLANGLARWDGEQWHRVHDVPPFYIGGGPNRIYDVELFQGELYIAGNLPLARDIAKWNGSTWEIVGGGFTSAFSAVNHIVSHHDKLYVTGSFARCAPNGNGMDPGNGIVAWDGTSWDDLGGGTCGSANGTVTTVTWLNDTLYAAGSFNLMGGVEGVDLARWDGNQWCMLTAPGYFENGHPIALAVFHDSLYVGGGQSVAGAYEFRRFGKWIGGEETYACGAITGVGTLEPASDAFSDLALVAYPSPASDQLLMRVPSWATSGCELLITDATGRVVRSELYSLGQPISVAQLASGAYSLTLRQPRTGLVASGRFIRL